MQKNKTKEITKLILGGKYLVTSVGKVYSLYYTNRVCCKKRDEPYLLKPTIDRGYERIRIGGKNGVGIHRLVLETFVGPCPKGKMAAHKNDIKSDNRLENLYWASPKENTQDAIRNNKFTEGEKHGNVKLTKLDIFEIRRLYSSGMKKRHIARKFNVHEGTIGGIVNGIKRIKDYQEALAIINPDAQKAGTP